MLETETFTKVFVTKYISKMYRELRIRVEKNPVAGCRPQKYETGTFSDRPYLINRKLKSL